MRVCRGAADRWGYHGRELHRVDRGGREQGASARRPLLPWYAIATQVIVTSFLFPDAKFSLERLQKIAQLVGKDRLVVDVRSVVHY